MLLVEDDPEFAGYLRAIFESGGSPGVELTWTTRLASALERLSNDGLDAVLLDLNLPDSQGLATLSRLLASTPTVPVIVLTGMDDMRLATDALAQGAEDWLVKGKLDPELVQRAIRYAIERKRLADTVIRSQKMEALGRLAGTVAHEFNNLLTVIQGSSYVVEAELPEDGRGRQAVRDIRDAAERGAAMTRQLLGIARRKPVRLEMLDLRTLVESSAQMLRSVLPESIALQVQVDPDAGSIHGDRGQLEQVLLNLAINARDAMRQGGTVSLRVRREQVAEEMQGSGRGGPISPGEYAVIDVSDTGDGIAPDVLPRIFEPFFSTKNDLGTGLGLAVSREIVANHGGALLVESTRGQGTTFHIYLPLANRAVSGSQAG